ncbi:hypothetical protein GX411_08900 [Candidatus Fermentibacteria bacterium]|nr:hypothetical protein [Candidatus Fermentibacteria bacterium]
MSGPDDIICYCGKVTRGAILNAISSGARTLEDIQRMTGAGVGSRCRELNPRGVCCHADILGILDETAESGARGSDCCCRGS